MNEEEIKLIIESLLFSASVRIQKKLGNEQQLMDLAEKINKEHNSPKLENISFYDDPNEKDEPWADNIPKDFSILRDVP
jgi:hypothetical protein